MGDKIFRNFDLFNPVFYQHAAVSMYAARFSSDSSGVGRKRVKEEVK